MSASDCQLLTLREAANRLRISLRSLHRLVAARQFPEPLKIGGRSLVPLADVIDYVNRLLAGREGRSA